jgi:hypothetical protein
MQKRMHASIYECGEGDRPDLLGRCAVEVLHNLSDDLGTEVCLHVEECHLLREVGKVVVDRIVEPAGVQGLGFGV